MKLGSIYLAGFSALLFAAALAGNRYSGLSDEVFISEICTSKTAAYDDNGDYAPYIELYNASDLSMNLKGWGLSDDKDSPYKYSFPKMTLPPGGTVILWLNGSEDDASEYLADYIPRDIHDNKAPVYPGKTCILSDASRRTLSVIDIPRDIPEGRSYASSLKHMESYAVAEPTPYYVAEDADHTETRAALSEPRYSLEGGWYEEGTKVEISCDEGEIYYTLDGSEPCETSLHYDGPIVLKDRSSEANRYSSVKEIAADDTYLPDYKVDKATVLKSVAIASGRRSPVKTETYLTGLKDTVYKDIPTVSVTMDPEDLFGYERGIYVKGRVYDEHMRKYGEEEPYEYANYAMSGRGWERSAKLEYFLPDTGKAFEQEIGIRIHGGYSTAYNQKSFNLYARDDKGPAAFSYDVYNNTKGNGICDKLVLRSGGENEMYVTKMRDLLLQSFMEGSNAGIQRGIPCNVFLNGEYWGMYNLQEAVCDCYVEEHYGTSKGNALIMKNLEPNKAGEAFAGEYYDMMSFIQDNDMSDEDNYSRAKELIDIDSCIDFYAAEIYFANADQYSNVAMWRAIEPEDMLPVGTR